MDRVVQMWKKLNGFTVTGAASFTNNDTTLALAIAKADSSVNSLSASSQLIRIVSTIAYGKYHAKIFKPPTSALVMTGNITAADLGIDGADCYLFNTSEVGWLGGPDNVAQLDGSSKIFVGHFFKTAPDGKPVYVTDGYDASTDCQGDS